MKITISSFFNCVQFEAVKIKVKSFCNVALGSLVPVPPNLIEEYSQEEIAKMKDVSQNTISKKLCRIKKPLTGMCRKEI